MGLKELFGKTSEKVVTKKEIDQLYKEAESKELLEEIIVDKERFLPTVDFSDPTNFARYGSAERYYVDSFKNIYENYPYDGSKKEKLEWRNGASQLDLYIFDNVYPKTTGYVSLKSNGYLSNINNYRSGSNPQYIKIKGGPNPSSKGKFETANLYDIDNNRESNLGITNYGNTVEFWFKDELSPTNANYNFSYALFDLWNGKNSSSPNYTRLAITKVNGTDKFAATYRSGSSGITSKLIDYEFDSSKWHHYAFTFSNINSEDLELCLYVDGDLKSRNVCLNGGGIDLADNAYSIAYIGALQSDLFTTNTINSGLGSSYGSYDEFRFWKTCRNSQQIYRNWLMQVGGGSNTDDANKDLGIYLKFNEGIINTEDISELDKICLDYSGRVSNGHIINYSLTCKSTGSAINEYLYDTLTEEDKKHKYAESKDPIIFSSNPLVQSLIEEYTDLGFQHDQKNVSNIYKTFPSWITDEAEKGDYKDLSYLTQIISSYFDTLHIQIADLPKIKNITYESDNKPKPFAKNLLSSAGFENLEIFNDTTFLEDVLSRNEETEFKDKLHNVKNAIYQNIYNNLSYIYKSKGTEKSLRNLIRCFGVDDELIKINLYANNAQYDLTTKYSYTSVPKKYIDFNNADRNEGCIYQKAIDGNSNTKPYIPGNIYTNAITYIPITLQAEVIFPKNPIIESKNYSISDFSEISLFGVHEARNNPNDLTFGDDRFNFQVYAIKKFVGDTGAYFKITGSFNTTAFELTTPYFKEIYDNQKWNFAVRIKPERYGYVNLTGDSDLGDYDVEFVGINCIGDVVNNQFNVFTKINKNEMDIALTHNKRVYVGAHYHDFDSDNTPVRTDVKISSVRFWLDYLNDSELLSHTLEANNFGREQPHWAPTFMASQPISSSAPMTRADTLVLNWNFFNVTSSDSNGNFIVEDASSGSVESANSYGIDWLNNILKYQMTGYAIEFSSNDTQIVNKEYVFSSKKQNPESLSGNDLVQITNIDDVTRTKNSNVVNYYISIEKSMAQVVNDEILNWFATIKSYNNLIGEPMLRYKQEYSGLRHLREIFFAKVNNSLNFEKFFEFYKWIDSSLSMMINQLIPASANSSDKVRNMVESHMLERSKYEHKLPLLEVKASPKSYPVVSHLHYSYNEQAATPNNLQDNVKVSRYYNFKPQWLKQRAIRTEAPINTSLEPQNDVDREILRQVINEKNIDSLPKLYSLETGKYDGRRDLSRMFTKLYKLSTDRQYIIEDVIRPVNIANNPVKSRFVFAGELAESSSKKQIIQPHTLKKKGNYYHSYEYLFASGRTTNNKSFVELEGDLSGPIHVYYGLRFTDTELPTRKTHKNIIVERFSAPGGWEVNGLGYMDVEANEYSAYNTLNYRNSRVRKNLNAWSAESSSINPEFPSYHKVNKNPVYHPFDINSSSASVDYDNAYVIHQIPQSDYQYSWITASSANKLTFSGLESQYDNLFHNTNTLSVSLFGNTKIPYVNYRHFGTVVDTYLTDKNVDVETNTISPGSLVGFSLFGPFTDQFYLTSLNGPYQWPSWKQIRNSDNQLVNLSRRNNYILVQDTPKLKTREFFANCKKIIQTYLDRREPTFTSYREPPISYNRPTDEKILMSGSALPIILVSTYDNNKQKLANLQLAKALGIGERSEVQTYDVVRVLENDEIYDPKPIVNEVSYSAQIFPTRVHAGLKESRNKSQYAEILGTGSNGYDRNAGVIRSFWRNNENNRRRSNSYYSISKTGSLNVLNIANLSASSASEYYISEIRHSASDWPFVPAMLQSKYYNNSYDSIFSLDNKNVISSSAVVTNINDTGEKTYFAFNLSSSLYGELAGMDEYDARKFFSEQKGSYFQQPVTLSTGQSTTLEYFKYDPSFNFPKPKASYSNKIKYPGAISKYEADITWIYELASALDGQVVVLPYGFYQDYTYYRNFVNEGMPYKTNLLAGKNPWYDSYEQYFEELRPLSLNRSIIPEYTFSKHADYYIKDKAGDFDTVPPKDYISCEGTDVDMNSIDNAYNITDTIKNFVFNDYQGNKKLKLTIDGVKKLLPYKGFYPQERTAQLVDLFQKSFFDIGMENVINGYSTNNLFPTYPSGSPLNQQVQTLLQPYFAPGILFNTIKSGIAVDWPVINTSSAPPDPEFSFELGPIYYNNSTPATAYFYETASFNSTDNNNALYVIGKRFTNRIPFESLLNLEGYRTEAKSTLYLLDPTRVSNESFADVTYDLNGRPSSPSLRYPQFNFENKTAKNIQSRTFIDKRYNLAMNNFLAETPKFFLQNQSLTSFTSEKTVNEINFNTNKKYEMMIKIEKREDVKMVLDTLINDYKYSSSQTSWAEIVTQSFNQANLPIPNGLPNYNMVDTIVTQSAKIPAASVFGPPTKYFNKSNGDNISLGHMAYDTPAYAPYAPPYYYGSQYLKLTLNPSKANYSSYEEIINELSVSCLPVTTEMQDYFSASVKSIGGLYNVNSIGETVSYQDRMPLLSAINYDILVPRNEVKYALNGEILDVTDKNDASNKLWRIQTKFETPVLNFNTKENINLNMTRTYTGTPIITTNINTDGPSPHNFLYEETRVIPKTTAFGFTGMWSGYAKPDSNSGITLSIVKPDRSTGVADLSDACGFKVETKNVGQIAAKKQISEAIVMIPFTKIKNHKESINDSVDISSAVTLKEILGENGKMDQSTTNGPYYFNVDKRVLNGLFREHGANTSFTDENLNYSDIKRLLSNMSDDNSIIKTMKAMTDYVIPPHLDWVRNRSIDPFVMYVFEFKHELLGDELADIWQGVMPRSAMQMYKDVVQLEHDLNEKNFFHGLKLPSDVQWKVFKVKKRANYLYDSLLEGREKRFTFKSGIDQELAYSYNWPYDYFSLVELVNIEASLELNKNTSVTGSNQ